MADPNLVIGMNSGDYFLYRLWRLLAIVLIALVACIAGCSSANDYYVLQALKLGIPADEVKCAFHTDTQITIACAAKQKK